jgi:cell division protein FtsI/penicillin-binding protein 2
MPSVKELPAPPSPEAVTLIGLRPDWLITPSTLLRTYPKLAAGDQRVRDGMLGAATHGTAHGLGIPALAKTGTAACSHRGGGPGDGLVVAMWPPEEPRYVLMVRLHGTTGAVAAKKAGELLRTVRDGR